MRELERERTRNEDALDALAIVGPGRVGRALAAAADAAGISTSLSGRQRSATALEGAETVLLTVPDEAIEGACEAAVAAAPRLRHIGHTSGATGLASLAAASERGVATFALHPLQTVPEGGAQLAGAPCAVAGSTSAALALATELAERLGMHPFEVPEEARAAYHAAACMASNFLVALEESAAELLERAGVEDPRELLAPLVLRTAANWSERGAGALTGPIARGDEATIERHLAALAEVHSELLDAYRVLAERTRAIAAAGSQEAPA